MSRLPQALFPEWTEGESSTSSGRGVRISESTKSVHKNNGEFEGRERGSYCNLAYSAFACFKMGMSGSASFQSVRKSWYAARASVVLPCME